MISILKPSLCQLAHIKLLKFLNHIVLFDHIMHTNAYQHYLTTGMCNILIMDEDLLSIISAGYGKLVKMLITIESIGIIG